MLKNIYWDSYNFLKYEKIRELGSYNYFCIVKKMKKRGSYNFFLSTAAGPGARYTTILFFFYFRCMFPVKDLVKAATQHPESNWILLELIYWEVAWDGPTK
jgi:hypothetical protein